MTSTMKEQLDWLASAREAETQGNAYSIGEKKQREIKADILARLLLVDVLAEACDRLLLWPMLHEQQHPEWNGNRFDDVQLAKKALAAYNSTKGETISLDGISVHYDGRIRLPNGDIVERLPKEYRPAPPAYDSCGGQKEGASK